MSACRSCGAEVLFERSATTGRTMILDAKPEKRVVVVAEGLTGAGARVVDTYTDHHVTCPEAPAWKGRTRKDPPPSLLEEPGAGGDTPPFEDREVAP